MSRLFGRLKRLTSTAESEMDRAEWVGCEDGPPGSWCNEKDEGVLNVNRLADITQGVEIRSLNLNCMN